MLKILIVMIIILFFLFFMIGQYFYNFAIKRSKKSFIHTNTDLSDLSFDLDEAIQWINSLEIKQLSIVSNDGLKLHAKYINKSSNKTVILIHGYNGNGLDMANFAKLFFDKYDFNVLLPDLRGHGDSEGNYIGFSYHDQFDLLKWINLMITLNGDETKIVLLGISMGAATVCATSGANLPRNVKFIISDCAFDSISGELAYQLKRMYKLPSFPIINFTSFVCKLRAGYFFRESDILKQVNKCNIPMLFIHGENDKFVPVQMVYQLYQAKNGDKELLLVKDAKHAEAFRKGKQAYIQAIEMFIKKYI